MSLKRLWSILKARNLEFFRDRSAFGWNFLFPFLLVAGFGIIFGGKAYTEYIHPNQRRSPSSGSTSRSVLKL
jgi:hypothetical protein